MIQKIVSGGQTGVDRAGLDAALPHGIPIGGYCPQTRRAEDGAIPSEYPLIETESADSRVRTELNVIHSDGTLILNKGDVTEGTLLTHQFTQLHQRPCLIVQLDREPPLDPADVVRWIRGQQIRTLNIAGPKESKRPDGIYTDALTYLNQVLVAMKVAD